MLKTTRSRQWQHWQSDYRCDHPPVICRGCGRHYPQHVSVAVMTFSGNALVSCSDCSEPKAEKPNLKTPVVFSIPNKVIGRDVACRYIVRYDGRTFWHQTDVDVADVYLQDREGNVIAKVSQFDTFPKPLDTTEFDDIPF